MIEPFSVAVPDADLDDLRARIGRTRWASVLPETGWAFGIDDTSLRDACRHWADGFDWRAHERWLNGYEQVLVHVDGARVHVVRAPAEPAAGRWVVLLHGWPSTVSEFRHVVEPLRDPARHGGDPADALDVVLVSLPGFGFGGPTATSGWDADRMGRAIVSALAELTIERFGVFGTDAGAYVATSIAAFHPDAVVGLHLHIGGVSLGRAARADAALSGEPTPDEARAFRRLERYETVDGAYAFLNGTKPHTIAYGLSDSPVGQAAWILEKFHEWTEPGASDGEPWGRVALDDALAIVSTYWFTATAASAARFYAEAGATLARDGLPRVAVPTGCAVFPGDIVTPSRRWAERAYPNIVHWTAMPAGGHFSALEVPGLLAEELRRFFQATWT